MAVVANDQSAASSTYQVFTAGQRPDLWKMAEGLAQVWPTYNGQGKYSHTYFGSLIPRYADFQIVIYHPSTDRVVARGRSIPFVWDGTLADLPAGIDAVGWRALEDRRPPTALSALAAEVAPDLQGQGLSRLVLQALCDTASDNRLGPLVAPVRPSWKDRYPLIPIDHYAYWQRDDGMPFDPWMRVHSHLGATILRAEPRSLQIEGSVADWQKWTGLKFPADGDYVFPFGLAPVHIEHGIGVYWEPNVWMLHEV
jgi:GNAT superfamily N-acetyltransferase